MDTFGQEWVVHGPVVGAVGELSTYIDFSADVMAEGLTAEHLFYCGDRGSKTVKAYYPQVPYRVRGLTAHRGWARLIFDRRGLVQAPDAQQDQSQHPRARNGYDERPLMIVK